MGDFALSLTILPQASARASMGLIAATKRFRLMGPKLIETDLTIQRGAAGGALMSADGQLIGMIVGNRYAAPGRDMTTYAIPIESIRFLLKDGPVEDGKIVQAGIGLKTQNIPQGDAPRWGLPDNRGAIISGVADNSAGAAAGLKAGDVIRVFGGMEIENGEDYLDRLRLYSPGETVELKIVRNKVLLTRTVRLGRV